MVLPRRVAQHTANLAPLRSPTIVGCALSPSCAGDDMLTAIADLIEAWSLHNTRLGQKRSSGPPFHPELAVMVKMDTLLMLTMGSLL